jgi:hypothetical protein
MLFTRYYFGALAEIIFADYQGALIAMVEAAITENPIQMR